MSLYHIGKKLLFNGYSVNSEIVVTRLKQPNKIGSAMSSSSLPSSSSESCDEQPKKRKRVESPHSLTDDQRRNFMKLVGNSLESKFGNILSIFKHDKGGMSVVYRVYLSRVGEIVVKVVDDLSKREFYKEVSVFENAAGAACPCHHYCYRSLNIDRNLRTTDTFAGIGAISLKYLPKKLGDIIDKDSAFAYKEVVRVINRISDYGIINYDVKPSSFLACRLSKIYMIDFSADWVERRVKTCECINDESWAPCRCLYGKDEKKLNCFIMKVLFSFVAWSYMDKGVENVLDFFYTFVYKEIVMSEWLEKDIVDKVFKYDENVRTLVIYYVYHKFVSNDEDLKDKLTEDNICINLWSLLKENIKYAATAENVVCAYRKAIDTAIEPYE